MCGIDYVMMRFCAFFPHIRSKEYGILFTMDRIWFNNFHFGIICGGWAHSGWFEFNSIITCACVQPNSPCNKRRKCNGKAISDYLISSNFNIRICKCMHASRTNTYNYENVFIVAKLPLSKGERLRIRTQRENRVTMLLTGRCAHSNFTALSHPFDQHRPKYW